MDKTPPTPTALLRDPGRLVRCTKYAARVAASAAARAVAFARRGVVAYLIVFSLIGLAFAVHQHEVNGQLRETDYHSCIERLHILQQANSKQRQLVTLTTTIVDKRQLPTYIRDAKRITPFRLPDCEHLKP